MHYLICFSLASLLVKNESTESPSSKHADVGKTYMMHASLALLGPLALAAHRAKTPIKQVHNTDSRHSMELEGP